jgi:hypothetical protein
LRRDYLSEREGAGDTRSPQPQPNFVGPDGLPPFGKTFVPLVLSPPPLLGAARQLRHREYAMSLAQWSLVFGTVLGWLLIIIFTMTVQRKLSRLLADFKLLSDDVSHLKLAEERRFMTKINARRKSNARRNKADHAHLEAGQTAAPPVVPVDLDDPAPK